MPRFHIAEIDIVRLFAAFSVFFFHVSWQNPALPNAVPWGWVGVEIFFVISGLVIGQSAFHSNASGFLQSRFFRLVPTAVICALIAQAAFLLVPASAYTERGVWVFQDFQAFLGSLILIYPVHSASAYWTLPVEISFYASIFVFLIAGKLNHLDRFFRLMVLLSAGYLHLLLASQFLFPSLAGLDFGYGLKNMLLLRHMPFFVLGYLIYRKGVGGLLSRSGVVRGLFCLYLCCLEIVIHAWQLIPEYYYITGFGALAVMALAMFLMAVFVIYRSACGELRIIGDSRTGPFLRLAGLMTYPVYLLHEVIGGATLYLAWKAGLPEGIGLMGAVLVVTALAAGVVLLEKSLNIRSRFNRKMVRHA